MFSVVKVIFITLVGVCLHLEADAPVRLLRAHHEPVKPLKEVEQIEEDIEQFPHLGSMYALVKNTLLPVPNVLLAPRIPPDKSNAEEIDGKEALEGNDVVLYYLHLRQYFLMYFSIPSTSKWMQEPRPSADLSHVTSSLLS